MHSGDGRYTIGLDFGTNSVRAVVVSVADGGIAGEGIFNYPHGDMGIMTDSSDPNLARQHPDDYITGIEGAVRIALRKAGDVADNVVGIGIDGTGSTPIPIDRNGCALALTDEYAENRDALAWLWKDHTAYREAIEITALAREKRPRFLAKCGGVYSAEWFWAKLLHCSRVAPDVFNRAYTWVELVDWVPALLTGNSAPESLKRSVCAAGHKAMFNPEWGGFPDKAFLALFDNGVLLPVRKTLPDMTVNIAERVGGLTDEWSGRLGLRPGIAVAAGAFDCHLGAVGCGIKPGTMVKVIGTSTCDIAVAPLQSDISDIPGVCGIVPESVLPGHYGIEAGQSAVGDIFGWYVNKLSPGSLSYEELTEGAELLSPGESGLLALDWNNGNRTVLVDQQLTGMVLGLTLHTSPFEVYRAFVEATAFGARMIRDRMVEYGVPVERVITCGGIAVKSPFLMQIYADVFGCRMSVARDEQTCALGSAMAGAVVAGEYRSFADAGAAMAGIREREYTPIAANVEVYDRLFALYRRLHDLFGTEEYCGNQFMVMKELIAIREEQRGG